MNELYKDLEDVFVMSLVVLIMSISAMIIVVTIINLLLTLF